MVEGIVGLILGMVIPFLLLTPKINHLTIKIEALTDVIRKLEARVEGVDQLRKDLFDLEKRVSDCEAEQRVHSKKIAFNEQNITEK